MEKKKQPSSKQIRKHKHILYDLFVTIENIIIGSSLLQRSFKDGCTMYQIRSCSYQPAVLLIYEEVAPEREESPQTNTENLKVGISNREIIKECSFASKQGINHRRIIYDLFLTIENVIIGASSATRDVIDGIITFKIKSTHQLTVLMLYELPLESENNDSLLQLIDDQQNHISENTPTLSRSHSLQKNFGNVNMTAVGEVSQQEENEPLKFVSDKNVKNKLHKNNPDVKSSSQESAITLLDCGKSKSYVTYNTSLNFKKVCKIKAGSSTFEKGKNLLNVKSLNSIDNKDKETIDYRNLTLNKKQLERKFSNEGIPEQMHSMKKTCEYSKKTFAKPTFKKYHKRKHTGKKTYKCEYCEKTFADVSNKKSHERMHTGVKPYKCDYCEKTFGHSATKKAHERLHTGVKPYKCDYCERTFTHLTSKINHERRHTGVKPYKCEYCEKTFAQWPQKKIHERLHTGERP